MNAGQVDPALQGFIEDASEGFVLLVERAREGSPLARAKVLLGDRFAEVAEEALKRHLARIAVDEGADSATLLRVAGASAGYALAADVYTSAVEDILEAAGIE